MVLSRKASGSARTDPERAISFLRESIAEAEESAKVSHETMLCLRTKLAQILLEAKRYRESLKSSQALLTTIDFTDWRQQLIAERLLDTERQCLLEFGEFDEARSVVQKIIELDLALIGKGTIETTKREARLVEVDFAKRDFDRVLAAGKPLVKMLEIDRDPLTYLLFVYVGVAELVSNETEEGYKNLDRALIIRRDYYAPPLPSCAVNVIDSLTDKDEIYKRIGVK